jgi:uncharacterized protein (DUF4213/DUF364 family)
MGESAPWAIYDRLIDSVPDDILVEDCLIGLHWILVRSIGIGLAMTPRDGDRTVSLTGNIRGMKVRALAALARSWNFLEASIGIAAINSVLNARETVLACWGPSVMSQPNENVFVLLRSKLAGKKVAVIGHFPDLDALASICQLSILERKPKEGDYPDPACEYILPEQDYVFITGTAIVNKTFPRLIALSHDANIVLVGPTTPLCPVFFDYGVSLLASLIVEEPSRVWKNVAEGGHRAIFAHGARMVKVAKNEERK